MGLNRRRTNPPLPLPQQQQKTDPGPLGTAIFSMLYAGYRHIRYLPAYQPSMSSKPARAASNSWFEMPRTSIAGSADSGDFRADTRRTTVNSEQLIVLPAASQLQVRVRGWRGITVVIAVFFKTIYVVLTKLGVKQANGQLNVLAHASPRQALSLFCLMNAYHQA